MKTKGQIEKYIACDIQKDLEDTLFQIEYYARHAVWNTTWLWWGVESYIKSEYLLAQLKNVQSLRGIGDKNLLRSAKILCAKAICSGIEQQSDDNKNYKCITQFIEKNLDLKREIYLELSQSPDFYSGFMDYMDNEERQHSMRMKSDTKQNENIQRIDHLHLSPEEQDMNDKINAKLIALEEGKLDQ